MAGQMADCPHCNLQTVLEQDSPKIYEQTKQKERLPEFPHRSESEIEILLPKMRASDISSLIFVFACLEIIGSMAAGLLIGLGEYNSELGWLVGVSGILSGLILLGFSKIIDNTYNSSQRLERIELIIQKQEVDRLEEKILRLTDLRDKSNRR
jgi:anti-anti-sigma regulatory factor